MKNLLIIITLLFLALSSFSNNLRLGNASFDGSQIDFEIAWDNSWNHSHIYGNHDAVWVFLKGKTPSGFWVHIDVIENSNKNWAKASLTIQVADDEKGAFIIPNQHGELNIPPTYISLSASKNILDFTEVRIFAIEMVYIPQGQFFVGDGVSISSLGDANGNPLFVQSEDAISSESISIVNPNEMFTPTPITADIPKDFPKGYASFYAMKYEVSQIQYVDFLNTLTFNQQKSRTTISPASLPGNNAMISFHSDSLYRNGIIIKEAGFEPNKPAVYAMDYNSDGIFNNDDDGLHRAANFLSWGDLSAYLDWAALRPLTELEYEKICRGANNSVVAGEFAWGTNLITNANNPLLDGTVFETVSDVLQAQSGLANHGNIVAIEGWGLRGVLRTGFAANESSNRLEAGAAFYGVMEMSGNVWEQTIMIANNGALFDGKPGDGTLADNGDANQPNWCNPATAFGVLLKGGGWGSTIGDVGSWRDLAVSDRFYSHINPSTRRNTVGGRGAR